MMPDNPRITVEISGPRHSGKSVLAARLQRVLRAADIAFDGPEELPPRPKAAIEAALLNLAARGLRVEFVETETPGFQQVDARPPRLRRVA